MGSGPFGAARCMIAQGFRVHGERQPRLQPDSLSPHTHPSHCQDGHLECWPHRPCPRTVMPLFPGTPVQTIMSVVRRTPAPALPTCTWRQPHLCLCPRFRASLLKASSQQGARWESAISTTQSQALKGPPPRLERHRGRLLVGPQFRR